MRFFNTTGPCEPARHYMQPAAPRLPDADRLFEQGAYLVLHAPRQSGKTTTLRALTQQVTAQGRYTALYFSCKVAECALGHRLAPGRGSSDQQRRSDQGATPR